MMAQITTPGTKGTYTSHVGLDLGDHCGWAELSIKHGCGGYSLMYGQWEHKPSRYDTASVRYDKFESNLRQLLALGDVKVWFERVDRHKGVAAAHVYGGYLATLQRVCDDLGISCHGIPVGTIKKFATGKGNADKDAMVVAAEILGYRPQSDNVADAIHIARLGFERGHA